MLNSPQSAAELTSLGIFTPSMLEFARRAATRTFPVLLCGETGTGKSVFARLIHLLGPRHDQAFKKMNCGAIPLNLMETTLFGHVRGAFTGANGAKGIFEEARHGTVFLDEVGELPTSLQPKLLGVLDDNSVCRVGSHNEISTDVRIITATHRNLSEMVEHREFRDDLYYRLAVLVYTLPPLRTRRNQIPEIVDFLLRRSSNGESVLAIEGDALDRLCALPLLGNIRQLANIISRAETWSNGRRISAADVRQATKEIKSPSVSNSCTSRSRYIRPNARSIELEAICAALTVKCGNVTQASQELGMSRATLNNKIKTYRISLAAFRRRT